MQGTRITSTTGISISKEQKLSKWEGKATAEVKNLKPEQVWSCLEDFCNLHKWQPNLDICYQVEGVPGQPGLIRYCASAQSSSGDDEGTSSIMWAKEKLLMIDPIRRCYGYEIVDNNMGFKSYVANIKVEAKDGIDGGSGCGIEMSFVADPIQGWRLEDLVSLIQGGLQSMAKNIERVLLPTT